MTNELMTFLSGDGGKVLAIFAAFLTGALILILGGRLACDIFDAYREKRIRELNRRTNK